jgi:tRNA (guanine37-N1)-methyltransferase
LWTLTCRNPRDFASDAYRSVDDRPYGGGPGMVMLAEPLERAIGAARRPLGEAGVARSPVICLTPHGEPLRHGRVVTLAAEAGVILVAGRYEAIDERVIDREVDLEIAVGDFVVSGGELPALLLIDAVARQLPGVLSDAQSRSRNRLSTAARLSALHASGGISRRDGAVGAASGDHAAVAKWRHKQALGRTWLRRPDLLALRA